MTDDLLEDVSHRAQTLTALGLSGRRQITDAGVRHPAKMPSLHHLDLSAARGVHRRLGAGVGSERDPDRSDVVGARRALLGHGAAATRSVVRASTTLLCGAALLLTASAVTGELARVDLRAISGRSLLGLAYLTICGSVVAFSAYTWLLERCSATLVATHTSY